MFSVGLIGLIASIYQIFGGPPWPVDPEIHPTSDGSSLIHPFIIKNRSGLFDMNEVQLRCGVDLFFGTDAREHVTIFRDMAAVTGTASIAAGNTVPYQCDTSKLFKTNPDGSLSFGGSSTIYQNSSRIHLPLKILKTCVWIGGEYKFLSLQMSFTSQIFQWPAIRGSSQWAEG